MQLTGKLFIGAGDLPAIEETLKALNPATNQRIEPAFALGDAASVDAAATLADEAFDSYSHTSLSWRAAFLESIADNLDAVRLELTARAALETGVPQAQLEGEATKAATQFRQFADVVRKGRFLQLSIDPEQPDRQPRPRMDHRLQKMAIGPVAIFGASNFPIAYSIAGGDTASALAAGAPVILKAHNAHPGASEIQAWAIRQAVQKHGLHPGVFSMVRGEGNTIGEALVDHPLVKAVTFTGSEHGGMALYRRAQQRHEPIPVFTEMTSVNPTFVLAHTLAQKGASIGDGFIERMLVNVGQACLKPALLIAIDGPGFELLRTAMIQRVAQAAARTMLTPGIHGAYVKALASVQHAGAALIAQGLASATAVDGQSMLLEVDGEQFLGEPALSQEVFGPAALLIKVRDEEELLAVARSLRGQLSAAIHLEAEDLPAARRLLPILERRTGRIVVNAFAHPQEVSFAAIHGGPYPATSDSRFTSVGMTSIERFLRPVCYQGFPDALLPEALRDGNPLRLDRLIDGQIN
ncbi:aldehyde dehydrogenase (NADP(+)) [Pseudomonas gingeri]|uniref:aldehyde dehydrogenase (NADP(+)) n=1 Tax=Pseudomonas gingeri TaxID=117681 RepID=UPI0015A10509|nr:aldehyde dehydrogenase (NADP(+)) [Pseudomonas gingeri]NWA02768.1 aldehyde dehydrogenase (NADP(+)) [Pseudomonas gingeri]NWA18271.1 aldehyde dehydrogenase (NADP(+)) [Pseudomonas gingeri]NWA58939.1 aldehyde dehydrogenase (NADP(+)) [Pseudomonas gingeri]NWA99518.1 aldehyde dehydrogenase (NADP(+)) [Pseudomonas gingeri]NWB05523.1 aldehyde dehydrogenase (NADP(+)) [Pseudomonas gingeri]